MFSCSRLTHLRLRATNLMCSSSSSSFAVRQYTLCFLLAHYNEFMECAFATGDATTLWCASRTVLLLSSSLSPVNIFLVCRDYKPYYAGEGFSPATFHQTYSSQDFCVLMPLRAMVLSHVSAPWSRCATHRFQIRSYDALTNDRAQLQ